MPQSEGEKGRINSRVDPQNIGGWLALGRAVVDGLLALGAARVAAARGTGTVAHQRLVDVRRLLEAPLVLEGRRVDVQVRLVRRLHAVRRLGVVPLLAVGAVAPRVHVIAARLRARIVVRHLQDGNFVHLRQA